MNTLKDLFKAIRKAGGLSKYDTYDTFEGWLFQTDNLSKRLNDFFRYVQQNPSLQIDGSEKVLFYGQFLATAYYAENCQAVTYLKFYYHLLRSENLLKPYNDFKSFLTFLTNAEKRTNFYVFLEQLDYLGKDESAETIKTEINQYYLTLADALKVIPEALNKSDFKSAYQAIKNTKQFDFYESFDDFNSQANAFLNLYFTEHLSNLIRGKGPITELQKALLKSEAYSETFASNPVIEVAVQNLKQQINIRQKEIEELEIETMLQDYEMFSIDELEKLRETAEKYSNTFENKYVATKAINKINGQIAIKKREKEDEELKLILKNFNIQKDRLVKTQPIATYCNDLDEVILQYETGIQHQYFKQLLVGKFSNPKDKQELFIPFFNNVCYSWNTNKINKVEAYNSIQNIALRLALSLPKGHLKIRLIDEDFGTNFQMLLGLPDEIRGTEIYYDETQVNLLFNQLKKRDSKVIFDKLKNQYKSLVDFNIQNIYEYEPLELILVNNFPAFFQEPFLKYIQNQMNKPTKTGVYYLFAVNENLLEDEEMKDIFNSIVSNSVNMTGSLADISPDTNFKSERIPLVELEKELIDISGNTVNRFTELYNSKKPFNQSQAANTKTAEEDKNTLNGIRIQIGATEKGQPVHLDFSEDSGAYHGLLCGTTGSGKTLLLHQIIYGGSIKYSPNELQFALLDYKNGVGFQNYENLPNTRILGIDADIEFGYLTLKYFIDLMKERAEQFKKFGVTKLSDYREKSKENCPRMLIIIDEFQVLVNGGEADRQITERTKQLMEDIVRQGRSYGVHLLLATQTPSGVKWNSSTLENIGARIGLRMSRDAEYYLFKHSKPIASAFTEKFGKGVINNKSGIESESFTFDVTPFDEGKLEILVNELAYDRKKEGNFPGKRTIFKQNQVYTKVINLNTIAWNSENKPLQISLGQRADISMAELTIPLKDEPLKNVLILGHPNETMNEMIGALLGQYIGASADTTKVTAFVGNPVFKEYINNSFNPTFLSSIQTQSTEFISKIDELHELINNTIDNPEFHFPRQIFIIYGLSQLTNLFPADNYSQTARQFAGKFNTILQQSQKINLTIIIMAEEKPMFQQIFGFNYNDFEYAISLPGIKNKYIVDTTDTYQLSANMGLLFQRKTNESIKFNRISINP